MLSMLLPLEIAAGAFALLGGSSAGCEDEVTFGGSLSKVSL
jgi:hypothetical protein